MDIGRVEFAGRALLLRIFTSVFAVRGLADEESAGSLTGGALIGSSSPLSNG